MLFNSWQFLVFFLVLVTLLLALPAKYRWIALLVASYAFYTVGSGWLVLWLIAVTLISFSAGIFIDRQPDKGRKRAVLTTALLIDIGALFVFKYFDMFSRSTRALAAALGSTVTPPLLNLVVPLAISFYTFQTAAYVIDVYRGTIPPERKVGRYALFVAFFPLLLAGPIERGHRLLPQLHREPGFDYDRITGGLKLFAWGLFKKVVIADRLAVFVNAVFGKPSQFSDVVLLVAAVAFSFQLYCDFSGYCDMAIGIARMLGYRLIDNFDSPYASRSIPEFWRRWHISLSTWFRDYLYIPLGGNRVGRARQYLNILIVFLVSGLWHGAAWTFVIWGGLHGAYLVASSATEKVRSRITHALGMHRLPRLHHALGIIITFSLVTVAWVFFRAASLSDATYIVERLPAGLANALLHPLDHAVASQLTATGLAKWDLVIVVLSIALLELVQFLWRRDGYRQRFAARPVWQRWSVYYGLVLWIFFFGRFGSQQFIYFKF